MTWLTVMEYLCHKWQRTCSTCRRHFPVLSSFIIYHRVKTILTRLGATTGTGTAYPFGASEFTSGFSLVRVARSLVLCVCFVSRCLFFCTLSFGLCVVCPSSIYGLWLPFGNFKLFLKTVPIILCYNIWLEYYNLAD